MSVVQREDRGLERLESCGWVRGKVNQLWDPLKISRLEGETGMYSLIRYDCSAITAFDRERLLSRI